MLLEKLKDGQIHKAIFNKVFGCEPSQAKLVTTEFSFLNGKFIFQPISNTGAYHYCTDNEMKIIQKAIALWAEKRYSTRKIPVQQLVRKSGICNSPLIHRRLSKC